MGDISNKADELTGSAKQAVGDITGDDQLRAEGAADKAAAQVTQGVEALADKAQETANEVKQDVSQTVDTRVVIAVLAGIAVVAALAIRRNRRTSRSKKQPVAKKAAAAGIARALTR